MSAYLRALAYYRPFLGKTVLGLALSLMANGINLLKPLPFKYIVDDILLGGQSQQFVLLWLKDKTALFGIFCLCMSSILVALVSGALNVAKTTIMSSVSLKALLRLRTELYSYLQSLPLTFHDARRSSDSSFRVVYDSQSIQSFYARSENLFSAAISIASTLAAIWFFDWHLTLVALAVVPFVFVILFYFGKRIRKNSTTIAERESDVLTVVQEGLSSVKMVQAFGREAHQLKELEKRASESLSANLQLTKTAMNSTLVVSTLMTAGVAAVYFMASRNVLDKTLTIGSLGVLVAYLQALYQPIETLTQTLWGMEGAVAGAQRYFEVLDSENEVPDAPNAKQIVSSKGEIAFENIQFTYDKRHPILADVSFHIAPGQTVAFVGSTGAGKSTLLSLVPRFYDPSGGRVLLDGIDIKHVSKKSLRNQIGIVLQDTLLFSTTIRENIAYGRLDATDEEIVEAAKQAHAHEFIMDLPEGYNSLVGERGNHLSMGQRQRIGIARAFLKNAPILLMDEPTSSLDTKTEAAIMETIKDLMKGRTTLIITHRIGLAHEIEKVAVLTRGRIVEVGSGAQLLKLNGVYAELYRSAHLTQIPSQERTAGQALAL